MQHELNISIYDLRMILVNLVGSRLELSIKLSNKEENSEMYRLTDFDEAIGILTLTGANKLDLVSIFEIEYIEFDRFHSYKGQSAKVMKVL